MFSTSKPSASLTSGLLARKGQARPAMRPQGYVNLTPTLEDLGWNDMGEEGAHVVTHLPPPQPAELPPVLAQLEVLKERVEMPVAAPPAPEPVPATPAERIEREVAAKPSRAAFTLRLDADRHLRLRLASAVRHQSAQQLVTEALDAFLDDLPEVDGLARQLGGKKK